MAREPDTPINEAADMFAVRPSSLLTNDQPSSAAPNATSLRPRQGQAAFGGALRAALTRRSRRGALPVRDEGQAFVARSAGTKKGVTL